MKYDGLTDLSFTGWIKNKNDCSENDIKNFYENKIKQLESSRKDKNTDSKNIKNQITVSSF